MWCEISIVVLLLVGVCVGNNGLDLDDASIRQHDRSITPDTPFRLMRVTKTEGADSYHVKLEYQASTTPQVVLRQSYSGPPTILSEQPLGAFELDLPKTPPHPEEMRDVMLTFLFPRLMFTARLRLNNTPDVMEVPVIDLRVTQGSDVKYKPGSDVTLDMTFAVGGDPRAVEEKESRYAFLVKTGEDSLRTYHMNGPEPTRSGSPVWLSHVSHREEGGDWVATTALINSTRPDPEGVLDLFPKVVFNCSLNCLLRELELDYQVSFYHDDHSGPFPDDFLGFVDHKYSPDPTNKVCSRGSDPTRQDTAARCVIPCEAAGSAPSSISISRVGPGGDVTPTHDVRIHSGYWSTAVLQVENVTFADAGLYRCTAASDVKTIERDITVVVIVQPKIVTELSNVTTHDNGSLSAVCVATGVPAPNVTFDTDDISSELPSLTSGQIHVTVTHPDSATTRTELFVDHPQAAQLWTIHCAATNVDHGPYSQYTAHNYIDVETGTSRCDYGC